MKRLSIAATIMALCFSVAALPAIGEAKTVTPTQKVAVHKQAKKEHKKAVKKTQHKKAKSKKMAQGAPAASLAPAN